MTPYLVTSLCLIWVSLVHLVSPERDDSVNATIHQTFNLASHLKGNSSFLLETYDGCKMETSDPNFHSWSRSTLSSIVPKATERSQDKDDQQSIIQLRHQGRPFTDKDFHAKGLSYNGVPAAAISFMEWRLLSDLDRLDKNYKAYSIISEFLQLVWDDQFELNPTEDDLLNMLKDTRMQVQGLVNNLTIIISALRAAPSPITDPLTLDIVKTNAFEKKVLGYVVCSTYKQWIDRTVRDFNLLVRKYPL